MTTANNISLGSLSRRSVAKGLALGALAAALPSSAQDENAHEKTDAAFFTGSAEQQWTSVMPGIWRLRFGSPEAFTPVATRCIAPAAKDFHRLPSVASPSIRASAAYVDRRGTTVLLPLANLLTEELGR